MKKLSELMLEGYAMVPRQAKGVFCRGNPNRPRSVCALGAVCLAKHGNADAFDRRTNNDHARFEMRVGITITKLNDEGMSIPDIAGIAAAEGL